MTEAGLQHQPSTPRAMQGLGNEGPPAPPSRANPAQSHLQPTETPARATACTQTNQQRGGSSGKPSGALWHLHPVYISLRTHPEALPPLPIATFPAATSSKSGHSLSLTGSIRAQHDEIPANSSSDGTTSSEQHSHSLGS